jgi:hypothetical protein
LERDMTHPDQLREDLTFVRNAVENKRRSPAPAAILWLWALYVLVGYTLLDLDPRAGGMFLMIAGPLCGIASGIIGSRASRLAGEMDRTEGRIETMHWLAVPIGVIALLALAAIHPVLRTTLGGQLIVVCIAIVYYLYGVHRDRNFLWLGMVLVAGGIGLSFVPIYPWTCLGIVIALGLIIPTFLRRSPDAPQA